MDCLLHSFLSNKYMKYLLFIIDNKKEKKIRKKFTKFTVKKIAVYIYKLS